jgi:hypothetical protein
MPTAPRELNRLINYWMKAEFMRYRYQAIKDEHGAAIAELVEAGQTDILERSSAVWHMNIFLDYWLGTLYLIVEGWRELKLQDSAIDNLIDLHLDSLRLFRNATFHYQRRPDKDFQFFDRSRTNWAKELHDAFDRYFHENDPNKGN